MVLLSATLNTKADMSKLRIHIRFSDRCCSILNLNWQPKIKKERQSFVQFFVQENTGFNVRVFH